METTGSSKMTQQTQTTEWNNPEETHFSNRLHENLTTYRPSKIRYYIQGVSLDCRACANSNAILDVSS